ncbi:hypothetical protein RJT34_28020 [Clitoria ternatea]|uniref:Protein kinase domain-containing protein n=1 Tax=Clitoria ternatea TaxID=43366 RepID=A0AAN9F888_CLITE
MFTCQQLSESQIPTTLDGPFDPVTRRFGPLLRRGSDDLPMTHPWFRKNVTSNFPEQIALAISSPTSMWVSWGDAQIGLNVTPVDPASVGRKVWYGKESGKLTGLGKGGSVVYTQLYPLEGLCNYTSGIIHHVKIEGTIFVAILSALVVPSLSPEPPFCVKMGCINSKNAVAGARSPSPESRCIVKVVPAPSSTKGNSGLVSFEAKTGSEDDRSSNKFKKNASKKSNGSSGFRTGLPNRHVEAEQNAAGWPPWLTASAAEAIQGWIPLKADSFQKLEKIGQGTYSSVFRAREVETGKMFALKKVRFDNFQPESIRFMAREITILRRLDHPNIMKLEGIITSRLSNSIYLVFEYMEHDLAGLVSRPEVVFSESQIKCYMRQLLSGLEHCHIHGIMHRDIKVSNILLNNEGVLKIGDFGLANTISTNNKHPLTSRVVTLWYRPPELLMGSTNYGVSVDLWSVGCVFAELFLGKPILKGRTEVEQLHKIFKLCGSPPDEFWKKSKLPHATMFKPQASYESSLRERCADFPITAVNLLETLLSIDPNNRGTASSALISEYFSTKPYPCNPSSLPRYPPSKEMDVKIRDDSSRQKTGTKTREVATSRRQNRKVSKALQEPNYIGKTASKEVLIFSSNVHHRDDGNTYYTMEKGVMHKEHAKPPMDTMSDTSQMMNIVDGNGYSVPVQVQGSSNAFTWVKRRKQDASSTLSDGSRSKISALDPYFAKGTYDLTNQRVTMDFDPAELLNPQVNVESRVTVKTNALESLHHTKLRGYCCQPKLKAPLSGDGEEQGAHWNDNGKRRTVRKSRIRIRSSPRTNARTHNNAFFHQSTTLTELDSYTSLKGQVQAGLADPFLWLASMLLAVCLFDGFDDSDLLSSLGR